MNQPPNDHPAQQHRHQSGSGSDKNSDTTRLRDEENRQDKVEEDSFPASDPPSTSPITGAGRKANQSDPSGLKSDFKSSTAQQFEYGRKSQESTLHADPSSRRLRTGNPNIGEVDLGTIEADRPAHRDDNDHFDSADDTDDVLPNKSR